MSRASTADPWASLRRAAALLAGPGRCLHCRGPAPTAAPLCATCAAGLPWAGTACPRCALPGGPCPPGRCPQDAGPLAAAWAPLEHAGPARSVVHAAKGGAPLPARWLAGVLAARVPAVLLADGPVVVPVPADPLRARRRGGDHAAVLARGLAGAHGLALRPVLRRHAVRAQRGADRIDRRRRAAQAHVATVGAVPDRPVLLVDDVHTTGATLRAGAAALHVGGAPAVRAVTATRAGRRGVGGR